MQIDYFDFIENCQIIDSQTFENKDQAELYYKNLAGNQLLNCIDQFNYILEEARPFYFDRWHPLKIDDYSFCVGYWKVIELFEEVFDGWNKSLIELAKLVHAKLNFINNAIPSHCLEKYNRAIKLYECLSQITKTILSNYAK